jgi:hypothetical protein
MAKVRVIVKVTVIVKLCVLCSEAHTTVRLCFSLSIHSSIEYFLFTGRRLCFLVNYSSCVKVTIIVKVTIMVTVSMK